MPRQRIEPQSQNGSTAPFAGFVLPTSNTTYVPNQFFDVCLTNCSRGTVRLVGLLIRKTLGWCDAEGRPQQERHAVSYSDMEKAGISRDMIRAAVSEALSCHFIRCVREPQPKAAGRPGVSGLYELNWNENGSYVKEPTQFRGFFAGEGNRTYIPNQFFDRVVRDEPLAVVKTVGAVIRFSIGFQNKWGHRRRNVALSYQHMQNYSRIRDRKTLSAAIRYSLESNYIERAEEGYFDPNGGRLSKAAVYAVKWLSEAEMLSISQKTPPAKSALSNQSENPTGIGQKSLPAHRSENPTDIEIKQRNKTLKQQPAVAATLERLMEVGFDAKAAQAITSRYSAERIDRQLGWIEGRRVKSNRLGLLRAAIEGDWAAPDDRQLGQPNQHRAAGASFDQAVAAMKNRIVRSTESSSS